MIQQSVMAEAGAQAQKLQDQAREFKEAAGLTGIILSKLDSTAKGGVVIAVKRELDVPVKFIGVGEQIDDLQPFEPQAFAAGLFNMEEPAARAEQEPVERAGQTAFAIMRSIRMMVCTCGRLRQLVPSSFQIYGTASMRKISMPTFAR